MNLAFYIKTNAAVILENNVPTLTLVYILETNEVYIRKNDAPVKSDLTLVSSLETNAVFILENNAPEQPDINLISRLEMSVVFILENNAPDLTLVYCLETISSLLPFPTTVLSYNFHYITDIDFTYHPTLYYSHVAWIESNIPILRLLISPFHLKYIVLFSHHD